MRRRKITLRSVLVAAVVALLSPALWFIVTGETYRTPTVETTMFAKMSQAQINEWIDKNSTRVSIWEHAKGTPQFVVENWRGYLAASTGVFIVVLLLNVTFLAGGRHEP
jgi:hypothetical protein